MVNVGVFYLDGMEGVAQDRAKGMAWFRKAAASKDEKAIGVLRKNALSGMSEAQTVLIDAGLK